MEGKKRICWVTSDWFVDVDMPVIPSLLEYYDIHWIVVLYKNGRYKEHEFDYLKSNPCLSIDFLHVNQRARHPRTIIDYWKIASKIKVCNADINYIDMVPGSPYFILPYLRIDNKKTVFVAHDGSIKSIMGKMTAAMFRIGYGWHSRYVHMFSKTQAEEFHRNYPGKDVTVIPLMPKDYGKPSVNTKVKPHSFLSFGTMHREKNIGLLIRAAEEIYEEGFTYFSVSICGLSADWNELYAPLVKHPNLFNLQLRMLDNAEIPDLFSMHQFVVYPYKAMSQSGALKVAYAYKKPVITSDLPAFREEVVEGVNGFFFHTEDVNSLKKVMLNCMQMKEEDYSKLVARVSKFVEDNYSKAAVKEAYHRMFEKIYKR